MPDIKAGASFNTIFVADDDEDDIAFLSYGLSRQGYKNVYKTFENGVELLDYLKSNLHLVPDLILLDLNMPLKNGYDTLKELKTHKTLRSIPVIILTASSNKADEEKCYTLGCKLFKTKPDSFDGYESLAMEILSLHQ